MLQRKRLPREAGTAMKSEGGGRVLGRVWRNVLAPLTQRAVYCQIQGPVQMLFCLLDGFTFLLCYVS